MDAAPTDPATLTFHFDFLSPYAYLAWTQVHALAARHGRTVTPVPTLLAALLAHGGTLGPAEIPAKRAYVFKDVVRTAHVLGVPLAPPPTHPFNPLWGLRVASLVGGADQRRLIDALFHATWGGGGGIDSEGAVAACAAGVGLDGDALVAAARTDDAKALLRAATDRAIAQGVFGVPTMIALGEVFWGYDSFGHLERFLGGADPIRTGAVPPDRLALWTAIEPSARRRRS